MDPIYLYRNSFNDHSYLFVYLVNMMTTSAAHDHVLNEHNVNPNIKAMEFAVRYNNKILSSSQSYVHLQGFYYFFLEDRWLSVPVRSNWSWQT